MFWKLAVSALLLPAYLGFSGVAAQAASNSEQLPAQSVTALQEPQYYANRYNNRNDCYDNNRSGGYYRNSYRPKRSYRQNSYHPQRSYYQQNSYQPKRHNNGYHQNSYQPQHHNSGHHQNYGHGNYYNH